mmetsp:Transcript_5912/g.8377  ORF Transcript_5912/g.8377 Transcript_5912/m.8377 type:complete len:224 (+) Transcript_5912:44-715(+)
MEKKRVVVLHGTASNSRIIQLQLATLISKLKDEFEFYFIDAPRICSEDNRHVKMMRSIFGKDQILREFAEASIDEHGWRVYKDIETAIDDAESLVSEPDAILGFSQGANFATMLVARAERRRGKRIPCVLMCGARPGWAKQCPDLFVSQLNSPALVVLAENDTVVGPDGPRLMADLFTKTHICTHKEGHKPLPSLDRNALSSIIIQIRNFLLTETSLSCRSFF